LTKETPSALVLIKKNSGGKVVKYKRYVKKVKEKSEFNIDQISTHTVLNWTMLSK